MAEKETGPVEAREAGAAEADAVDVYPTTRKAQGNSVVVLAIEKVELEGVAVEVLLREI